MISSLGIKESKVPGFWEPVVGQSSRSVCLLSAQGTESFVAIKYSKISFVFIPDIITWPVRILGGSYKWIIFLRQSFHDRKVSSSFQVATNSSWVYPWFSRFLPQYTGKKPVVTRLVSRLLFVCFIPQQKLNVYSSMLWTVMVTWYKFAPV